MSQMRVVIGIKTEDAERRLHFFRPRDPLLET